MKKLSLKKVVFPLITSVLVCSFIFSPISQSFRTQKADAAVDNIAGEMGAWAQTMITAKGTMVQTGLQASLVRKEFIDDNIAWALVNIVVKEMIRSTTKWVASGFKGSPAFVTDLNGFLLNIGDKVAGNFIYGAGLGALCSPFKLNIQAALDLSYQKTRGYQAQCRLSQVVANMDRFLDGDFAQGGWDGWYEVALGSSNPYTTKFAAETAMYASISSAQGEQIKLLDFGKGFFSIKDPSCNVDMGPCPNVTPGTAVESLVNSTLGLPEKRLVVADELNELLGSLLSQLAGEVLSGASGLLGVGSSSGNNNYWSRVDADTTVVGHIGSSEPVFKTTLDQERKFILLNTTIVDMVSDVRGYREAMYPVRTYTDSDTGRTVTTTPCASGELTPSLQRALTTAQVNIDSSTVLVQEITRLQTDYDAVQNVSIAPATLQTLMRTYNSTSIPDTKSRILEQYLRYESSGRAHGINVLVDLEMTTIPDLGTEIAAFKASIDTACRNYNDNNSNGG